jgi:hypothetical protein
MIEEEGVQQKTGRVVCLKNFGRQSILLDKTEKSEDPNAVPDSFRVADDPLRISFFFACQNAVSGPQPSCPAIRRWPVAI